MTDTTDIAALRERMMQQREAALNGNAPHFEESELLVCDLLRALTLSNKQLEAERQQREAADAALESECYIHIDTMASMREWKQRAEAAEKDLQIANAAGGRAVYQLVVAGEEVFKLRSEIAELRAKLANPVVLSDCSFEAVSHMAHWYSEGECVAWVAGAEHVKKQILSAGFPVREA